MDFFSSDFSMDFLESEEIIILESVARQTFEKVVLVV